MLDAPHDRLRHLREAAGYATAADFARAHGFEEGTYRSHENGSRGVRFRAAMTYATALDPLNANEAALWMLEGGQRPASVQSAETALVSAFEEDYALIPNYDVRAAAGGGAVFDGENVLDRLAFRRQWLRTVTNAPLDMLAVIQAHGDSMEPTTRSGDHMLVDRSDINPRREGIYVIAWDGVINVKRITVDYANKTLTVSSDNALHPSTQGVSPNDLTVLGRVIWIGRQL